MFKLFSLIAMLLPLCVLAREDGGSGVLVSTMPEDMSSVIFLGADSEMPVTGEYDFSIEVPESFQRNPPISVESALEQMRGILPRWYLSALLQSKGEYECSVRVNGSSYSVLVSNWLWVKWRMDSDESELRRAFADLGVRSSSLIRQALNSGLCVDLKHGREAALEAVSNYRP